MLACISCSVIYFSFCNCRGSSCCKCCWYVCLQSSLWSLAWKCHGKTLKRFSMYYYYIQIHTHTCSTVSPLGWLFIFRLFPLDYQSRPLGQSLSFQVQFSFSLMHLVLSNFFPASRGNCNLHNHLKSESSVYFLSSYGQETFLIWGWCRCRQVCLIMGPRAVHFK